MYLFSKVKTRKVQRYELYYDSNIFIEVGLCVVAVLSRALMIAVAFPSSIPPPPLYILSHYQMPPSCLNNMVLNPCLMLGM